MAREECEALFLGQVSADAGFQDGLFDEAGDVFVGEAGVEGAFAVTGGAHEDWTEVEFRKVQPLFEGMHGAGLLVRSTPDFDLAPAGF